MVRSVTKICEKMQCSLQLLVTFCRLLLSNWLLLGGTTSSSWPRFPPLCLLRTQLTRPQNFDPQIGWLSKKVAQLKLGLNWDQNWPGNLGKGGKKGPFVVILNYRASMSACMCFPPFSPQSGLWPPRDRDGLTSRAEYRFNMFRSFQFSAAHISRHKEPTCIGFTTPGENIFPTKALRWSGYKGLAFGVFRRKLCP